MRRVAALYRQSTLKQESIPYQQHVIRDYVQSQRDMTLVSEYIEEGVSAYKISKDDRDILQDALADAKQKKFEILLIFKADRLSRIALEYPIVLYQFRQGGVNVISVADGGRLLKIEDHMDMLVRFIEGWQAQGESENTSIRVRTAQIDKAKRGWWSGGNPAYGFDLTHDKRMPLRINETEASIIKLMVSLYHQGHGFKGVAFWLTEHGYKNREGELWSEGRVRFILQNPIIAGLPAYGRSKPGSRGRRRIKDCYNLSNPDIIVPRDDKGELKPMLELQIITLDEWYALTSEMTRRAKSIGFKRPPADRPSFKAMFGESLLTGFLKCGYCGKSMINSGTSYNYRVRSRGKDYYYIRRNYRCITRARKGPYSCSAQSGYSQKKIDSIFIKEIEDFLNNLDIAGLEGMVDSSHWTEMAQLQTRIKVLEKDFKRNEQVYKSWVTRLDAHFADSSSSLYSEDLLAGKVKEYNGLLVKCRSDIDEARKELSLAKASRNALQDFVSRAPQWFQLFKEASVQEKKQLLKTVVKTIDVYRDKLVINYHINLMNFVNKEHQNVEERYTIKRTVVAKY